LDLTLPHLSSQRTPADFRQMLEQYIRDLRAQIDRLRRKLSQ
jgi:phage shock protein A